MSQEECRSLKKIGYPVRTTKYFDKNKGRENRRTIKAKWIQYISDNLVKTVVRKDGRIREWGKIKEASGKYLSRLRH